jgi:DNA-binding XRE family transcriptional regulator
MDMAEFLKWRKSLGYTQEEAGKKLGVSRATIQNWEKGVTRIPRAAELACLQVARRWKQRPEFGPVALVYTDGPVWQEPLQSRTTSRVPRCGRNSRACFDHAKAVAVFLRQWSIEKARSTSDPPIRVFIWTIALV